MSENAGEERSEGEGEAEQDPCDRGDRVVRRRTSLLSVAATLVVLVGVGLVLSLARQFMIPFALALLFAVALNPVSHFLSERWSFPGWATGLVALVIVGALASGVGIVAYLGFAEVATALPEYHAKIDAAAENGLLGVEGVLGEDLTASLDLDGGVDSLIEVESVGEMARNIAGSSLSFLGGLGLTLMFLLFFVATRDTLVDKLRALLRSRGFDEDEADQTLSDISDQITRYLWLKTAICVVTGGLFGLAAWLGGTPFPVFWGFVAFAFNYVPSIGPPIASILPIVLTLLTFDSLAWAIGLSAILASIQLISGVVVEPKLLGDRLDLNVITVFLSLLFWGLVWGPMGMLLGVPLTGIIHIVLDTSPRTRDIAELMAA